MANGRVSQQKEVPATQGEDKPAVVGGYDTGGAKVYNNQSVLKPADLAALTCSRCAFLLKEPRQVIQCGHRYCQLCIELMTNGSEGPYRCLVDQEVFKISEIRNDKGCRRDILALEVDCPTDHPCVWRGKLTAVEAHRWTCPNRRIKCDLGCGGLFQNGDLETHKKTECSKRLSSCTHCLQDIPLDSLEAHLGVCKEHPVTCIYCQKNIPARKQLTSHLDQDCDEYYMDCSHAPCPYKGRKSDMVDHILKAHLIQSMERMNGMEAKMTALQSENEKLCDKISSVQGTVSDLTAQVESLTKANKQKDVDIVSLKSVIAELQEEKEDRDRPNIPNRSFGDTIEKDGLTKGSKGNVQKDSVARNTTKQRPTNLTDIGREKMQYRVAETGHDDTHLKALSVGPGMYPSQREELYSLTGMAGSGKPEVEISRVKQEMEVQQTQLLKMNDSIQTVQDSLTRYAVAIDEVRLRQDVLDVKTTHGILVWKIPDIRRRYRDAVDRRTISLYSPPFYTSPHGYRMCIRTYLNGDGIGKGTHLSMFFVVMRSEHDNLLNWPFKQSVRFTLINQKNPGGSITEAFVPDLNSPSFQKPENDMNIASGFPKFARQSVLQDDNFTQGNVIYIKCQVDLTGLTAQ